MEMWHKFIQYLVEISPTGLQMQCVDKQPYLYSSL